MPGKEKEGNISPPLLKPRFATDSVAHLSTTCSRDYDLCVSKLL